MMMRKIAIGFVAALLIGGATATAIAGAKYGPYLVYVSSTYAEGSLADARASSDGTQYIGCNLTGYQTSMSGYCYANDSAGNYKMCSVPASAAPSMLPVIASLNSQTYLYFAFDASGNCTTIQTSTNSYHAPMVP
jgi:hypothetical protein